MVLPRVLGLTILTALASACAAPSDDEAEATDDALHVAPAALQCLAGHYVGTPSRNADGSWWLTLPGGQKLRWNDGQTKTFAQLLASPDLEDTLAQPYTTGAIHPITTVNQDPGRIRSDALFKATFGATRSAVQSQLVDVAFVGQTVKFHPRAAPALGRVSKRLEQLVAATPSLAAYVTGALGGTFEWRVIANTNRMSAHSYATAIDIVVAKSNYWEWDRVGDHFTWHNKIPQAIVDAFEAEGFIWGGRWYHYDTMHFEYRPELLDPACTP